MKEENIKVNNKKKNNQGRKHFKIAVQAVSFLLMPSLFLSIFLSIKNIVTGTIHQTITFAALLPDILLLLIVTLVTAFAGRFFCGWMCAFGSMGDAIYGIRRLITRKSTKLPKSLDSILKYVKYILLFGIIVFIWELQLITIPAGVNPWDLFGMLLSFGNWPSMNELVQGWIPAILILLATITGSFFVERFFCRYFCPLGAYFSIISRIRPIIIVKHREKCGACSLCTKKCSMGITLSQVDEVHSGECINCMECVNNCPRTNAHFELGDVKVNAVVAGTSSCALVLGAVYLGTFCDERFNLLNETTPSTVSAQSNTTSENALVDGIYEGTGKGFRGDTTVSVVVLEGIVTDIQIVSTNDDDKYMNRASGQIISNMIAAQSADVDTVSGATYSSNGLIEAVSEALSQAAADQDSIAVIQTKEDIDTTEITESSDDIKTTEDTQKTETSVSDSSSETVTLADIEDGTYEGSGIGFRGETKVSVTVSGGEITDVSILSYQDDQRFFDRASETVMEEIIANQDVNVDAVSGATYSSNGIMAAVADALNFDYTQPVVSNGRGRHGRH